MATNPVLSEIDALSPAAKAALQGAHEQAAPQTAGMMTPNAGQPVPHMSAIQPTTPGNPQMEQDRKTPQSMPVPSMPTDHMTSPPPLMSAPKTNVVAAQGTTPGDMQERQRLIDTGSGISQIKSPWKRGLAEAANDVGTVFAPGIARLVPGTEEHHQMLLNKTNNNLQTDLGNDTKQGLIQKQSLENQAEPQKTEDTHELTQAAIGKDQADKWDALPGVLGPNGEPVEREEKSGQVRFGDVSGLQPVKPGSPEQETYDSLLKSGMTPEQAYEKIKTKPPTTNINQGTWSIEEDHDGKPVLFNSKTGQTQDAPSGIQKTGTAAKKDAAAAPAKQAVSYADDYLANKRYTGSGDEALQEKFFELAKPATGFRMTQPQMDMLQNSRDWMGSLEAHLRHATTGTWFSDEQRQQIAQTMHDLAKAKGIEGGEGMITVQIPGQEPGPIHASQKSAFLAKYPNAKVTE